MVPVILLLTGTCGSGKTTVSTLLGARAGWVRLAEDEIWSRLFGRDRGAFGSDEHRRKRGAVHEQVFTGVGEAVRAGNRCVIDATVHESPPEAFLEYRDFFASLRVSWTMRVLHPRLEVAVARDAGRPGWHAGAARVADLRGKYTGRAFSAEWFLDTSEESPEETVSRVLSS